MDINDLLSIDGEYSPVAYPVKSRLQFVDGPEIIRREDICRDCLDRPEGCWKTVEYGCEIARAKAGTEAAKTGSCPIGKFLTPALTPRRIVMFSSPRYKARLAACRETWLDDARALGQTVDVVDSELLGVPDTYDTLPMKTAAACRYALDFYDWDHLFKCDDDTYVSIPRFMAYDLKGREYVGGSRCYNSGVSYCHGGAGYFLSRRMAEVVAKELAGQTGGEDWWVGYALKNAGVWPHFDGRFIGSGNVDIWRAVRSRAVTFHTKSLPLFRLCHVDAGMNSPPPPPPETPLARSTRLRANRMKLLAK